MVEGSENAFHYELYQLLSGQVGTISLTVNTLIMYQIKILFHFFLRQAMCEIDVGQCPLDSEKTFGPAEKY